MFHVRSNDIAFYPNRVQKDVESNLSYGRSVIGRLSDRERRDAEDVMDGYLHRPGTMPERSRGGNCQTFTTDMYGELEDRKLLKSGTKQYYTQHHGRRGEDIGRSLKADGRSWILAERKPERLDPTEADARFGERTTRKRPGKLQMGPFEDTFAGQDQPR